MRDPVVVLGMGASVAAGAATELLYQLHVLLITLGAVGAVIVAVIVIITTTHQFQVRQAVH